MFLKCRGEPLWELWGKLCIKNTAFLFCTQSPVAECVQNHLNRLKLTVCHKDNIAAGFCGVYVILETKPQVQFSARVPMPLLLKSSATTPQGFNTAHIHDLGHALHWEIKLHLPYRGGVHTYLCTFKYENKTKLCVLTGRKNEEKKRQINQSEP